MVKDPKHKGTGGRSLQGWEGGSGTWEPGGAALQTPRIIISYRQKPLGSSPRDQSITRASSGGTGS